MKPLLLVSLALTTALTFPLLREQQPPLFDDWDLLWEFHTLSLRAFLLEPSGAGHFWPLFKLAYAGSLGVGEYANELLLIAQFLARQATLVVWLVLLRRMGSLSLAPAVVCLAAACNEVGAVGVFYWVVELARESALLCFAGSVYCGVRYAESGERLVLAGHGALALAASLSQGVGVVSAASLPAAWLLASRGRLAGRAARGFGGALVAGLAVTALVSWTLSEPAGLSSDRSVRDWITGTSAYLVAGFVKNSAIGGLTTGVIPGSLSALFVGILLLGWLLVLRTDDSWPRRFVVSSLVLQWLGIAVLISLTRWQAGPSHASSYRYLHNAVALQLPLLAFLIGGALASRADGFVRGSEILRFGALAVAFGLLGLAVCGQVVGNNRHDSLARANRACVRQILAGTGTPPCFPDVYWRHDGDFIRLVAATVARRVPKAP